MITKKTTSKHHYLCEGLHFQADHKISPQVFWYFPTQWAQCEQLGQFTRAAASGCRRMYSICCSRLLLLKGMSGIVLFFFVIPGTRISSASFATWKIHSLTNLQTMSRKRWVTLGSWGVKRAPEFGWTSNDSHKLLGGPHRSRHQGDQRAWWMEHSPWVTLVFS